jgi:hypothetical protein
VTPTVQSTAALSTLGTALNPLDHSTLNGYHMNAVTIGFSDVKLFIGAGPYFRQGQAVDPDAVGLVIDNLDLASHSSATPSTRSRACTRCRPPATSSASSA